MKYEPKYTHQALKDIKKLPSRTRNKIEKAIIAISEDPYVGKPLLGILSGKWSFRVGDYRITYEIRKKELIILVLMVGPRQDIYKRLLRFLEG